MEATNGSFYVELWDRRAGNYINVRDEGGVRAFLEYWFKDFLPRDDRARHCINTLEEWAQSPRFEKTPEVVAAENYLEVAAQKHLVRPSVLRTLPREPSRADIHLITVADSEEAVQEACRVFGQDEATSCLSYIEAIDGGKTMHRVREAARREDDKLTALSVIFDGFARTHQAAHEEHELRLQAVREARLLPLPSSKPYAKRQPLPWPCGPTSRARAPHATQNCGRKGEPPHHHSPANACGHTGTPGSAPTHHCWASPKPASKRPSPNRRSYYPPQRPREHSHSTRSCCVDNDSPSTPALNVDSTSDPIE